MNNHLTTGAANRQRVRELTEVGLKPAEIAKVLGLTRQRVYQIKKIIRAMDTDQQEQADVGLD